MYVYIYICTQHCKGKTKETPPKVLSPTTTGSLKHSKREYLRVGSALSWVREYMCRSYNVQTTMGNIRCGHSEKKPKLWTTNNPVMGVDNYPL